VTERHWPQPRLRTRTRRAGQRWVVGCGQLGLNPPATPLGRRPGPAAAPAVTGPLAQRRQRPRRRITPNANTTTTTTISTHNHVDTAASSVGAEQFAVTLLPPTRANNSVTASQPSPNHRDQHHTRGGPGRRQPTQRDHSDPDPRGMARPSSVCPAWVGEQSKHGCTDAQWQTPRRRRRPDGARLRRHPNLRRGRLHHPAFPVQPRSALRDPPRVGPAEGNSAAATPLLSCRGPMVSSTRWPLQRGHPWCFRGRGRVFRGRGRPG
jgi:hypothetical protein